MKTGRETQHELHPTVYDSHPSLKMLKTDGSEQHMQAQIGEHAPRT